MKEGGRRLAARRSDDGALRGERENGDVPGVFHRVRLRGAVGAHDAPRRAGARHRPARPVRQHRLPAAPRRGNHRLLRAVLRLSLRPAQTRYPPSKSHVFLIVV